MRILAISADGNYAYWNMNNLQAAWMERNNVLVKLQGEIRPVTLACDSVEEAEFSLSVLLGWVTDSISWVGSYPGKIATGEKIRQCARERIAAKNKPTGRPEDQEGSEECLK